MDEIDEQDASRILINHEIAVDIYNWFEIVFKSLVNVKDQNLTRGKLIGLIYALRSTKTITEEQMDDLISIMLFKLPIDRHEKHNEYIFQ